MHIASIAATIFLLNSIISSILPFPFSPVFLFNTNLPQIIGVTDPDVESGFPAQGIQQSGTYWDGASINTLVVNVNDDPQLEIFGSALSKGPLYGWNYYGSLLNGWPSPANNGVVFASAGRLIQGSKNLQVVGADFTGNLVAYDSNGLPLPGWPQSNVAGGLTAPILADFTGDGVDEILIAGLYSMGIYAANGTLLPGWPISIHPKIAGIAIADVNLDNHYEIVVFTEPSNGYTCLKIYLDTGATSTDCATTFFGDVRMYPVIGDVDADGNLEIVVNSTSQIVVINEWGQMERVIPTSPSFYGTPPALADLNGDAIPEILVLTNTNMYVFNGDGSNYPGWPVPMSGFSTQKTGPVVGDVDGDQLPEVAVYADSLYIFNSDGTLYRKKTIPSTRLSSAIADLDSDGRNEVICTTNNWGGTTGFDDALWVFDFGGGPHGKIEWGQYAGGPQHQGIYPPPSLTLPKSGHAVYLPIIMRPPAVRPQWLRGQFNLNGVPLEGLPVNLLLDNGINFQKILSVSTDSAGKYQFSSFPALGAGQSYYVTVEPGVYSYIGQLSFWMSREVGTFYSESQVDLGEVNLEDIPLISPVNDFSGSLPITFTWGLRTTPAVDFYAIEIFDPVDFDTVLVDMPVQENSGLKVYTLPAGFSLNQDIGWDVKLFGSDGSFGFSYESRIFNATATSLTLTDLLEVDQWTTMLRPQY